MFLKDEERGSWLLGRSYSFCKEYDKQRKKSNDIDVKSYKKIPDAMIQKNAGFIIFNDLASTPNDRICASDNVHAGNVVRGLVQIERWTGNENIGRSRIMCPAIIVSYQYFMNGVDRVDQMRIDQSYKAQRG